MPSRKVLMNHGPSSSHSTDRFPVGARVLAPWRDQFVYPATVAAREPAGLLVHYDDGVALVVPEASLAPITVEAGECIFIRPRAETRLMYYPAVVLRVQGERLDVRFEASELMQGHEERDLPVGR